MGDWGFKNGGVSGCVTCHVEPQSNDGGEDQWVGVEGRLGKRRSTRPADPIWDPGTTVCGKGTHLELLEMHCHVELEAGGVFLFFFFGVGNRRPSPAVTIVPEAPNWLQHRIASTNQHPIGMGTKKYVAHGASGVAEG